MALPRIVVKSIIASSFDATTLTIPYQAFAGGGLSNSCFRVRITNTSNNLVEISLDGNTLTDVIVPNGIWDMGVQRDAQPQSDMCQWKQGQQFWVSSATANAGTIVLAGY